MTNTAELFRAADAMFELIVNADDTGATLHVGEDEIPALLDTAEKLVHDAMTMIDDCVANGLTNDDDIRDYLYDDELNATVVYAVRLLEKGYRP